jgi:hypothetical protein
MGQGRKSVRRIFLMLTAVLSVSQTVRADILDYYMMGILPAVKGGAKYDSASLQGAWIGKSSQTTRIYMVMDGAGELSEIGAFHVPYPAGTYRVGRDGNVSISLSVNESTMTLSGEMVSASEFNVTLPSQSGPYSAKMRRVSNMAACEGSWSVTVDALLNNDTDVPPADHFTLTVNSQGAVTDMTGFAAPIAGRFFCEEGDMVAHLKTGESEDGQYSEMTFYGAVSQNGIDGYGTVDNGSEGNPDLKLTFTKNTPAASTAFTPQMLAGKTFYTYGYEMNGTQVGTGNRFIATFNADATQVNVHNHADDTYGSFSVDALNSIVEGKMHWNSDGTSGSVTTAIKLFEDGSFLALVADPDHADPYPQLFSTVELADKGREVIDAYLAGLTLTKATMTAASWYGVDWAEYDIGNHSGDLHCQALWTFNSDDTIRIDYVDESDQTQWMDIGTYEVINNVLIPTYNANAGENAGTYTMTPITLTDSEVIWANETAYFKSRADAVAFVELLGGDEGCYRYFPAQ